MANASQKNAYFGDLHVHTRYSYDAFFFGTYASPDDAYRFARGELLRHPAGFDIRLTRPLDFYAVTDHAYFLGMWWSIKNNPDHPLRSDPDAVSIVDAKSIAERAAAFGRAFRFSKTKLHREDVRTAWKDIQAAAERHNDPGRFTTFIAFEFTPEANMDGLHRNVIYRSNKVPRSLIGRFETLNPEDLWAWMDRHRENGIESLAIPHNMNLSNGKMYDAITFLGDPLDETYAAIRSRNEPIAEITQVKGTSDTHPFLSPNDEWANFEIAPYKLGGFNLSQPQGSYIRQAWLDGLAMAERGFNPFEFGVIGSSDTHNGGQHYDESKYVSKVGDFSVTPESRGSVPVATGAAGAGYRETTQRYYSASGIAGVWAEENTRQAIFDSLKRKETFGTTGPRIKVRLIAGYDPDGSWQSKPPFDQKDTVLQGGRLITKPAQIPKFLAWALADPTGAELQRIQMIKGWREDAQSFEKVYDIACARDQVVNPVTHRCPDNGARVNIENCSITRNTGSSELRTIWSDPDFDSEQRAFYYVRVLENPTCRWSTWDAIRAGVRPRPDLPVTIQERAWTSPIWLMPE